MKIRHYVSHLSMLFGSKMKFPQWKDDHCSINQLNMQGPSFRSLHVCSSVRFPIYPTDSLYYNDNGFSKPPLDPAGYHSVRV